MLAQDFYPEGHQGGVGVIQNGLRVATNGDLRLDATPGQWSPIPKVGGHSIDKATQTIRVQMHYPNEDMDRHGFNPIIYPDLHFSYSVRVVPVGKSFKIIILKKVLLPDKNFISYLCTIAKNMLLNEYEHQTIQFIYRASYCIRGYTTVSF